MQEVKTERKTEESVTEETVHFSRRGGHLKKFSDKLLFQICLAVQSHQPSVLTVFISASKVSCPDTEKAFKNNHASLTAGQDKRKVLFHSLLVLVLTG